MPPKGGLTRGHSFRGVGPHPTPLLPPPPSPPSPALPCSAHDLTALPWRRQRAPRGTGRGVRGLPPAPARGSAQPRPTQRAGTPAAHTTVFALQTFCRRAPRCAPRACRSPAPLSWPAHPPGRHRPRRQRLLAAWLTRSRAAARCRACWPRRRPRSSACPCRTGPARPPFWARCSRWRPPTAVRSKRCTQPRQQR
jgi:hypothetical protein